MLNGWREKRQIPGSVSDVLGVSKDPVAVGYKAMMGVIEDWSKKHPDAGRVDLEVLFYEPWSPRVGELHFVK